MKAMNKVASHINEMQKIHEEYGAVFDQLISEQSSEKKEVQFHYKKYPIGLCDLNIWAISINK